MRAVLGTLNSVLNPADAQRYEEIARQNQRLEEERYWHEYWRGLEEQRAERYRQEAQERRRWEEERYWRAYRAGLRDAYHDDHGRDEPTYHTPGYDRHRYDRDRSRWGEDD